MTCCPMAVRFVTPADFTRVIDGSGVVVTVAVDGGEVTCPPPGAVPEAVAEFLMLPALKSAAVTM